MTKKLLFIVLTALLFFPVLFNAQDLPEPPVPPRLVNDFSGLLDASAREQLEAALAQFDRETSTQIAIVTINDLAGYDVSDFAFRLAEKWGIGQKDKRNGILILVKPKTGNEKGQVFIATGYGLEGAVPDAVAHRIVDLEILPRFRQNDYAGGLQAAATVLMDLTRGEYTADAYIEKSGSGSEHVAGIIFLFFFFLVIFFVVKGQKTKSSAIGHDLPFWVLMSMLGSGSRHSGSWDSFSSGSGGFGGFGGGGGGFGGFGGGSFGGGGAGGSW